MNESVIQNELNKLKEELSKLKDNLNKSVDEILLKLSIKLKKELIIEFRKRILSDLKDGEKSVEDISDREKDSPQQSDSKPSSILAPNLEAIIYSDEKPSKDFDEEEQKTIDSIKLLQHLGIVKEKKPSREAKICPRCRGYGEVMKRDFAIDSDGSEDIGNTPYVIECPKCKGHGTLKEKFPEFPSCLICKKTFQDYYCEDCCETKVLDEYKKLKIKSIDKVKEDLIAKFLPIWFKLLKRLTAYGGANRTDFDEYEKWEKRSKK